MSVTLFGELPNLTISLEAAGTISAAIAGAAGYIGKEIVTRFFAYLKDTNAAYNTILKEKDAQHKEEMERELKSRATAITELSETLGRVDEERMANTKLLMDLQRTTTDVLSKMEVTLGLIRERVSHSDRQ